MGLFSALNTSTEGLRRTHDALAVVSQNVSNASNPNYVRRDFISGEGPVGDQVRRSLEPYIQKRVWRESALTGFSAAQSDVMKQLDQLYGAPDSQSNLSAGYNQLYAAFQSLRSDPSSIAQQTSLLSAAKSFTAKLNGLSDDIQSLRSGVEDALATATTEANDALTTLAGLNQKIGNSGVSVDPSLLDARDTAIKVLSSLFDVSVSQASDGTVSLTTSNGNSLLDASGARTLSFDSHAPLSANSSYNSVSTLRSVGTVTLSGGGAGGLDLIAAGALKSGRLGGLIDLRDRALVSAQSQLDDIAAGFSSALSDNDRASSAVTGGFDLDLTGLQPGNRISLSYKDSSGVDHKVTIIRVEDSSVLPLANTSTADPNDSVIGISFAAGVAGAKAGLQTALDALGSGLTVDIGTAGALSLTATGSAAVNSLSARITSTTMTGSGTAFPFFVDGGNGSIPFTDSRDTPSQLLGFASRIAVNPTLLSNSAALSIYQSPANQAADPTRPSDLIDRLDKTGLESSQNSNLGLAGSSLPLAQMIKQTLQVQANEIRRVSLAHETQTILQSSIESRFSSVSGVQLDQELSDMTQLQNAYTANARVLSAVRDMLDVLMRI